LNSAQCIGALERTAKRGEKNAQREVPPNRIGNAQKYAGRRTARRDQKIDKEFVADWETNAKKNHLRKVLALGGETVEAKGAPLPD